MAQAANGAIIRPGDVADVSLVHRIIIQLRVLMAERLSTSASVAPSANLLTVIDSVRTVYPSINAHYQKV